MKMNIYKGIHSQYITDICPSLYMMLQSSHWSTEGKNLCFTIRGKSFFCTLVSPEVDLRFLYTTFTLQTSFKKLLFNGGEDVKSVRRGDCEQQGGKLLRLLSQLHPRIWPLDRVVHCMLFYATESWPPQLPGTIWRPRGLKRGWNRVYMEKAFSIYSVKVRGLLHTILVSF